MAGSRVSLSSRAQAVMTVLENRDRWETSNVDVTEGRVTTYEKPSAPGRHRFLDYGMLAMGASAFDGCRRRALRPGLVMRDLVAHALAGAAGVEALLRHRERGSILTTERFLGEAPLPLAEFSS